MIEVMLVVGILGVMASLAVPLLVPEVHKAQLNGDTEAVANFIARVRAEAMRSKRCTRIVLDGTGKLLTAHRLNSFNCDDTTPTELIDPTDPSGAFIEIDRLAPESPNVTYSTPTLPAHPGGEIRFRPNGRVFSNDALANVPVLTNDDAIVVVTHLRLPSTANRNSRRILVNSNGLICAHDRGVLPTGGPTDFNCN